MTASSDRFRDLNALLAALCDHTAEPQDIKRIESLAHDDVGINHVLDYLHLDGLLRWEFGAGVEKNDSDAGEKPCGEPAAGGSPDADERPIIILTTDATRAPFFSLQSPLALGLVSYSAALLIVGVALLGAWIHKIDRGGGSSIATNENSRGLTAPGELSHARPAPVFVGRVTGIAGAKWSDEPNYIAPIGVRVALGRKYKLKSGLMEITYDSGAKVILEGPCDYKVDSTAGGYLALGKLVARVGAGGEGRGAGKVASGQWPVDSVKDENGQRNPASLATRHSPLATNDSPLATRHSPLATRHSPLATNPSPLFTVRTPTAIVTDLGTEFGVEVDVNGDNTSHVFQGSIAVRTVKGSAASAASNAGQITLTAGQSARVEKDAATGDAWIITGSQAGVAPNFVRRIGFDPAEAERIVERFDGPELGPAFEQSPPGRFVILEGAAEYRNPPDNQGRGYIRTRATDLCDRDFIFEATIEVRLEQADPGNVARQFFIGIGDGEPNADFYDTVACGITFGYVIDSGLLQVVVRLPETKVGHEQNEVIAQMGTGMTPGRHRFRMWKRGAWMGFEVDADYKGEFRRDFSTRPINLKTASLPLDATNSRLYVGTGNCDPGIVRIDDMTVFFSETTPRPNADNP